MKCCESIECCYRHSYFDLLDSSKRPALQLDYKFPSYSCMSSDHTITLKDFETKQNIGTIILPYESCTSSCSPYMIKMQDETPQVHLQVDLNRSKWNCSHPREDHFCSKDHSFHIFGDGNKKIGKIIPIRECFGCGNLVFQATFPANLAPHAKALLIGQCYFLV